MYAKYIMKKLENEILAIECVFCDTHPKLYVAYYNTKAQRLECILPAEVLARGESRPQYDYSDIGVLE